jgi:hypothetical protein
VPGSPQRGNLRREQRLSAEEARRKQHVGFSLVWLKERRRKNKLNFQVIVGR